MQWLSRMTMAIEYIEDHLAEDICYDQVAKLALCSVHQFGRVFSYIAGVSLTEYIRRRRLTLAALDLQREDGTKVIEVALKYGYESPDAFTRAFSAMHGMPPKAVRQSGVMLKAYPKISFQLTIKGFEPLSYRIEDREEIVLEGYVSSAKRQTSNGILNDWKAEAGDTWNIWQAFFESGMDQALAEEKLYREPLWQMGFTQTLENGDVLIAIGAETRGESERDRFAIPSSKWAVFTVRGSLQGAEHPIDAMWTRITSEWFPTSGYKRAAAYEIEVYPPGDTASEDYTCEIWVPVCFED